jgi:hypothetical protein|tara:strand:- start:1346 stop:1606 length:261 start_codon:yes stop_codon:yes gene_type:complete
MIKVDQYDKEDQGEMKSLIEEISQEFDKPISSLNSSSKTNTIDKLWLAKKNGALLRTIGILRLTDNNGILKSVFVKKELRGEHMGV